MDIYSKPGSKVIVTEQTAKSGYTSDVELVKEKLGIGKIYTVDYTDVDNWYTTVFLQEFPNVPFNSVNFEDFKE